MEKTQTMSIQYIPSQFVPSSIDQVMYDSVAKGKSKKYEKRLLQLDKEWAEQGEP